jgi:uncharacterized membrane protein
LILKITMGHFSFVIFCLLPLGVAGYAVIVYSLFPLGAFVHPDMRAVFETNKLGIYTHIFGSAIALGLGPFQFITRFRKKHPSLHRWFGRFYLGFGIFLGGLSGLYMSSQAFGGLVAQTGFAVLSILWLYSGLRAYTAIRARNISLHRRWMVRNFALTFAAVMLRIYLPSSIAAGIYFETAYPIIAWLCWVPNVIIAEIILSKTRNTIWDERGKSSGDYKLGR